MRGRRLALGEVRRAAPDGRTLVYATSGPFAIYPHVYTKLDYDPDRDFTPIAGISTFDVAISTGPMTGATDAQGDDRLGPGRRVPGGASSAAAPGDGSLSHFLGISVDLAADLKMTPVPYKDSGVGLIDLASARLPMMITGPVRLRSSCTRPARSGCSRSRASSARRWCPTCRR